VTRPPRWATIERWRATVGSQCPGTIHTCRPPESGYEASKVDSLKPRKCIHLGALRAQIPTQSRTTVFHAYRGTSLIRKRPPPYDPPMTLGLDLRLGPRGVRFLVSEVPLYALRSHKCRKPPRCHATTLHAHALRSQACRMRKGYRGTSLIRKCLPLGPYGRPMRRALAWS